MGREDSDLVEEAFEAGDGLRKSNGDGARGNQANHGGSFTGAESVSRGRMRLRIEQRSHGVGDIFRGKRGAIREIDSPAKMKCDGAAVARNTPGGGERGFENLRLAVQANQDAASEIADVFGRFIIHKDGIERFRLAVKAKMKFAAGLRAHR